MLHNMTHSYPSDERPGSTSRNRWQHNFCLLHIHYAIQSARKLYMQLFHNSKLYRSLISDYNTFIMPYAVHSTRTHGGWRAATDIVFRQALASHVHAAAVDEHGQIEARTVRTVEHVDVALSAKRHTHLHNKIGDCMSTVNQPQAYTRKYTNM